jgi:hypothetical protein
MSPEDLAAAVAIFDNDKLIRVHRRAGKRLRLSLLAILVCIAAGIWIDWRWLPTLLIPAALGFYYGWIASLVWAELKKRADAKKEAEQ